MVEKRSVWVRIAVNKKAIREGSPLRWRCFIDPELKEIPLARCEFEGVVNSENFKTISRAEPDERGVIGWLHVFCDIRIADSIAYITPQMRAYENSSVLCSACTQD